MSISHPSKDHSSLPRQVSYEYAQDKAPSRFYGSPATLYTHLSPGNSEHARISGLEKAAAIASGLDEISSCGTAPCPMCCRILG